MIDAGFSGASTVDATAGVDSGLLSPVRAGLPIEAVVSDEAWLSAMLSAEAALVRTQARLGLVPAEHARTISESAAATAIDITDLARRSRENANPVVALVDMFTREVAARDPAAATYVHRGSTSQDIFDTALMMVVRDALDLVMGDLDRIVVAVADLARTHRDTVMAGRTLTQHAVPITFGLKAAGWLVAVRGCRHRIGQLRQEGLYAQLGGAAGTLAGYVEYARIDGHDVDQYATALLTEYAREVGLAEPLLPWHTARIPLAEVAAAMALTAGVLGKIGADVAVLARTEIGELAEPGPAGRGASSAMPHKRNPVLATMVRIAATQVPLCAAAVVQCLPAEDERPAGLWQSEWQPLRECLRLTGGAAATVAELVEGLTVFPDQMARNVNLVGELVASERVAAVLAPKLGKAQARALVTSLCAQSVAEGTSLSSLLLAHDLLPAEQVRDLLDPTRYTGVAGMLVDRALRQDER